VRVPINEKEKPADTSAFRDKCDQRKSTMFVNARRGEKDKRATQCVEGGRKKFGIVQKNRPGIDEGGMELDYNRSSKGER